MADDKKKAPPEEKPNFFVDAIFWILLVTVLFSVLKGVADGLNITASLPSFSDIFATIFGPVQIFSVFLSLLFLIGIIYCHVKLSDLLHHGGGHGGHGHGHSHDETEAAIKSFHPPKERVPDKRWLSVKSKLDSHSEGDWRLSIIEADIILEDMLTRMGYHGEGIGEKLQKVEKSDFQTLDLAWEAHKVRNRIAHDGPSYHLTHDDAKRVIGQFEKVFEEFYFI